MELLQRQVALVLLQHQVDDIRGLRLQLRNQSGKSASQGCGPLSAALEGLAAQQEGRASLQSLGQRGRVSGGTADNDSVMLAFENPLREVVSRQCAPEPAAARIVLVQEDSRLLAARAQSAWQAAQQQSTCPCSQVIQSACGTMLTCHMRREYAAPVSCAAVAGTRQRPAGPSHAK